MNRVNGQTTPYFTRPITALSLTTPTVSRDFILYCFGVHEHTLPMARESRLCGCVVSLVSPQPARAVSASSSAPWTRSRQEQIESDLRAAWKDDPIVLTNGLGVPQVLEKSHRTQ